MVNLSQPSAQTRIKGVYYIMITDEHGQPVAPAQTFRAGIWTYTFSEAGSVTKGTRTARMVADPQSAGANALKVVPFTLNAPFSGGKTYVFFLSLN
ncbi:MAG: hypothetical protein D4R97_07235 [Bacteroidetes bacterium]|nr:MAG: hypothetical protein D4R97_07235 [Bacteroidota bacterium]